jgi:AbrB family looped-hinge helix DNA binding protein
LAQATKVKLQRVGNSLRATIPKEIADKLSLKHGDIVNVRSHDGLIEIEKVKNNSGTAKFYGALKVKDVKNWPTTQEIKNIWE